MVRKQIQQVVIIGAGAGGREVSDMFQLPSIKSQYNLIGFLDDIVIPGKIVNGIEVLGNDTWFNDPKRKVSVLAVCAIGTSQLRSQVVEKYLRKGMQFCTVIHPSAVLGRFILIGAGSIVAAGAILTNNVVIGEHAFINTGVTIGHDVIAGPFVTFNPGAHINGHATIEEGVYIGSGAVVLHGGIVLGAWSIVGAGAVVTKNVPSHTTVVGVPAQPHLITGESNE